MKEHKKLSWLLSVCVVINVAFFVKNSNDSHKVGMRDIAPKQIVVQSKPKIQSSTKQILVDLYGLPEQKARVLALIIDDASKVESVPTERLIAIIKVESNFSGNAVSPIGAIGYGQVRPNIWQGETQYNVYDKHENIYLAAHILKRYHKRFNDWDGATQAYNIGETNYHKGVQLDRSQVYLSKINKQLIKINKFKTNISS